MDSESRNQFIAGLDNAFKSIGAASLEEGCESAAKLFEMIAIKIRQLGNREELEKVLAADTVSAEERNIAVAAAEQLPSLVSAAVQWLSASLAKDFPAQPQGRPKSLSKAQEVEACEYVGKLFSSGATLKVAKQRAAAKFGVSQTTIERVWVDRKKNARKPSLNEIIRFFKSE